MIGVSVQITDIQVELLEALAKAKEPRDTTAAKTGYWLRTYQALEEKKLIKADRQQGNLTNPAECIYWSLTPLGREILEASGGKK